VKKSHSNPTAGHTSAGGTYLLITIDIETWSPKTHYLMMLAESQKKTRINPVLFLLRSEKYLHLLASEALADGKPNNDADHNDDGKDDELHFHVLEPHLPPKLFALPLEVVGLETKILGLVN